jgi:hypothetical protein
MDTSHLERPHDPLFSANFPSTVGIAYFVVFGSQRDVLLAWCFWRKDDTATKTATSESGALFVEDPTVLHKDASAVSLPDARDMDEIVRPGFSPVYTPRAHQSTRSSFFRNGRRPEPHNPSVFYLEAF